ncbi:MAG: hypothetical protein RLZZ502_1586, partial [Pseudomonadota bacterium]
GGIDLAGEVLSSTAPQFKTGDLVIAHSFDVGVAHHGGYAEMARIPAAWVVPMPPGMSTFEAMALGTAGFTAALAIERMQHNGLQPNSGPVIINGATGGVGMIAIDIMAALGYEVHAVTGKAKDAQLLKDIGAQQVIIRQDLQMSDKPLLAETYAGAIDNLGGAMLGWFTRVMKVGGSIGAVGLAAGWELNTTVMPFILRGVNLLGIDSVNCPMPQRVALWNKLASEWKPTHLAPNTRTVEFDQLPQVFDDFINAQVTGRVVVSVA